jgi:hypothetical protein
LRHLLERVTDAEDIVGQAEVLRCLAGLEASVGDYGAAAVALDRVLEVCEAVSLDGLTPNVTAHRAAMALELGDEAGARELVERASALNRPGAEAAAVTAWLCAGVWARLDEPAAATDQYRLAHELLEYGLDGLSESARVRAKTDVPEHASIVEHYQRRFPVLASATVPRSSAPAGRPLRADEYVDLEWTPSDPSDWEAESPAARRRRRVARLVQEAEMAGGSARMVDLAAALGVSERTIKRDLAQLRSESGVDLTAGRQRS